MYNNIYMIICGLKATDPKWDAPPSSRNTFWCSTWGMGNGLVKLVGWIIIPAFIPYL